MSARTPNSAAQWRDLGEWTGRTPRPTKTSMGTFHRGKSPILSPQFIAVDTIKSALLSVPALDALQSRSGVMPPALPQRRISKGITAARHSDMAHNRLVCPPRNHGATAPALGPKTFQNNVLTLRKEVFAPGPVPQVARRPLSPARGLSSTAKPGNHLRRSHRTDHRAPRRRGRAGPGRGAADRRQVHTLEDRGNWTGGCSRPAVSFRGR